MRNIKIKVDKYEYRIIANALMLLRTQQIEKGKTTDYIDELLEKILNK